MPAVEIAQPQRAAEFSGKVSYYPMVVRLLLLIAGLAFHTVNSSRAGEADYPIRPVPFTKVRVTDSFWTPRLETNRATTVWYDFGKC